MATTTQSNNIVSETVQAVNRYLLSADVPYAVLRNYENYPIFGHDMDIVLPSEYLSDFQKQLTLLAEQLGWDVLSECYHWAGCPHPHQNIEVFRFYHIQSNAYLQIDVFHGYLLWSLPLIDEAGLLEGRIKDQRGFNRIATNLENMFRLLQIRSILDSQRESEKRERYRQRVLDHWQGNKDIFQAFCADVFSTSTVEINDVLKHLENNDWANYGARIDSIKKRFLWKHFVTKPFQTLSYLLSRAQYVFRTYYTDSCGFVLTVAIQSPTQKQWVIDTLVSLTENNLLPCYSIDHAGERSINKRERRVMERGGIVVKCVNDQSVDIQISSESTPESIYRSMITSLIYRHHLLFCRQEVTL